MGLKKGTALPQRTILQRGGYRKEEMAELRKKYKPGQKLKIMIAEKTNDINGVGVNALQEFTVEKAYKHHVSMKNRAGFLTSFRYVELEQVAAEM